MKTNANKKFDIYQVITDKITAMLEQGIIPWHKPWTGTLAGAVSYTSRKPYSLLNQMMRGEPGEYITYTECTKLGGTIKKGAKSQMVVFWKRYPIEEKDAQGNVVLDRNGEPKKKNIPLLRYFNVFNIKDCEGIKAHRKAKVNHNDPLAEGEAVINAYVGREEHLKFVSEVSNKAYYSPSEDKVVVPELSQYEHPNAYYATAFHELTHSTLKASRCDREAENAGAYFGNEGYSKEEPVAELGSAYLMANCGIDTDDTTKNSAAYIQNWLQALQNDKKMIVGAAGKAEYAAKYILTGERRAEQA